MAFSPFFETASAPDGDRITAHTPPLNSKSFSADLWTADISMPAAHLIRTPVISLATSTLKIARSVSCNAGRGIGSFDVYARQKRLLPGGGKDRCRPGPVPRKPRGSGF